MIKFHNLNSDQPYLHFKKLYDEALANDQKGIEAISISSFDKELNQVEARYVNLKYIIDNEWIFFSNYESPKAHQFESHSQISVLIYWPSIVSQIRIKAEIFKTSNELSDKHFYGRTKEKNALAISSNQSKIIDSFEEVKKNFHTTLESMTSNSARPDFWGGYSFIPYYFEFWKGHENRLNRRHVFEYKDQSWKERLLQP